MKKRVSRAELEQELLRARSALATRRVREKYARDFAAERAAWAAEVAGQLFESQRVAREIRALAVSIQVSARAIVKDGALDKEPCASVVAPEPE